MREPNRDLLAEFGHGSSIAVRWTAARELMAARKLASVIDTQEFRMGWEEVAKETKLGSGIDRLIAIDLVIRLSRFGKMRLGASSLGLSR